MDRGVQGLHGTDIYFTCPRTYGNRQALWCRNIVSQDERHRFCGRDASRLPYVLGVPIMHLTSTILTSPDWGSYHPSHNIPSIFGAVQDCALPRISALVICCGFDIVFPADLTPTFQETFAFSAISISTPSIHTKPSCFQLYLLRGSYRVSESARCRRGLSNPDRGSEGCGN